ncbi:MAG: hypothetical protein ACKOXF_10720 [Chitinophagaceae bacterium]
MFNFSLKKTLLSKPLIWNTRVFQMLSFAIIFHLIYFLLGYGSFNDIRYLYNHDSDFEFISKIGLHLTAGLVLFIAVVIWLFHYLRNNPFKSFYPVSKNYLRKESLLIVFIFFFSITIYHSYEYGKLIKSKKVAKGVYDPKDIDVIRQAVCFLPYELEFFERQNCCDSTISRSKRYKEMDPDYCGPGETYQGDYEGSINENTSEMAIEVAPLPVPTEENYVKQYSYLYYCGNIEYYSLDNRKALPVHTTAKRWLLGHHKDSIKQLLTDYIKIANKYRIRHTLDANSLTELCFADSFKIESSLYDCYYDEEVLPRENSAEFRTLNNAPLRLLSLQKESFFTISMWEVYGYVTLGLSVLLLSFRFTRFKPWIVSVLGSGVVFILFAIITNLLTYENDIVYFYLGFTLLCIIMAIQSIQSKKNKLHSGVWLNWSAFALSGFIPVVMKLIYDNTGEIRNCINHYYVIVRPEAPIHDWIGSNWELIHAGNFALLIVYFFVVYIPLAYKWQANPSE